MEQAPLSRQIDELSKLVRAQRLPEAFLETSANRVGVLLTVELHQQKGFVFADVEVGAAKRVLDNVLSRIPNKPDNEFGPPRRKAGGRASHLRYFIDDLHHIGR